MDKEVINRRYIQARMNVADKGKGKLLGFGTIILENSIVIKNVRLYEGKKGVFVSFPQRKTKDYGYLPYISCEDQLLEEITQAIMLDLVYQDTSNISVEYIMIRPAHTDKGVLAYADVKLTMGLTIKDIRVVAGPYGTATIMPQYAGKDLVYPLGRKNREKLNMEVVKKYRDLTK